LETGKDEENDMSQKKGLKLTEKQEANHGEFQS